MRRPTIAVLALFLLFTVADRVVAQSGRDLFQQALVKERANGDLRGAIAIYERIVRDFASDRSLAANALVQLGECYEKLGSSEAERAYQRVVSEYADQTDFVARARDHLAALRSAAAAGGAPVARRVLSPEDTDMNDFVEMSPSLDGGRLAYVNMWDGNVYVRDLASGDVRQLTSGRPKTWHYFPKWSPDGKRLAVAITDLAARVTSIQLIDVATRAITDVPGTRTEGQGTIFPANWSRDGRFLLCVREHHLVLVALSDASMTTLAESVREQGGTLSPDGRFVVYATGANGSSRAFIRPIAGGEAVPITPPQGNASNPQWSPDGRAIAFEFGNGISVVPVADGTVSGAPQQALVTGVISLRGWTEHGLYYTAWGRGKQTNAAYQMPMNPTTGSPAAEEPQRLPGRHPDRFQFFAWSPDVRRVAFSDYRSSTIAISYTDRGTLETFELHRGGFALHPWWSVDGREVLVHRAVLAERGLDSVSAVDPATGGVRDLPLVPREWGASFSADGRTVAFARQAESESQWSVSEIVVAPAGGGAGQVVAATGEGEAAISINVWPKISPRGEQVMYIRQNRQTEPDVEPGPGTLWVVGSDGRGARVLATAPRIRNAVWDPTGRFIAYSALESTADTARSTLTVVDVRTAVAQQIPLPVTFPRNAVVTDWSSDGRLLGLVTTAEERWEYWVVEGVETGGR